MKFNEKFQWYIIEFNPYTITDCKVMWRSRTYKSIYAQFKKLVSYNNRFKNGFNYVIVDYANLNQVFSRVFIREERKEKEALPFI